MHISLRKYGCTELKKESQQITAKRMHEDEIKRNEFARSRFVYASKSCGFMAQIPGFEFL